MKKRRGYTSFLLANGEKY